MEAEDQAKAPNEEAKAPESESENQQPEVEAKIEEDPNVIALKKSEEQVKEWKDKVYYIYFWSIVVLTTKCSTYDFWLTSKITKR